MVEQKLQTWRKKCIYQEDNEEETHRKVRRRDLVIWEGKGGERACPMNFLQNRAILRSPNSENTSLLYTGLLKLLS